jgi:hypothetical protein
LEEVAFWHVQGMMTFFNIGFTHAVGEFKYLTCADCEKEVLGIVFTASPEELFLAAHRVAYTPLPPLPPAPRPSE